MVRPLGEILIELGVLDNAGLARALEYSKAKNIDLGGALQKLRLCTERQVAVALAKQHTVDYIDLVDSHVSQSDLKSIPEDVVLKSLTLPLGERDGFMRRAITDPMDFQTIDTLRFMFGMPIQPVVACKSRIRDCVERILKPDKRRFIDKTGGM